MVHYELLIEMREFLSELVFTCFYTNYHFEHQGVKLSDYSEFSEINLKQDSKIYMIPGMIKLN
jgi:hypothetical protein